MFYSEKFVEDLEGEERGAFLRRDGLYEADLRAWKAALEEAVGGHGDPRESGRHLGWPRPRSG
jgi:hypothetical protein